VNELVCRAVSRANLILTTHVVSRCINRVYHGKARLLECFLELFLRTAKLDAFNDIEV
jgi:hypothetical protein